MLRSDNGQDALTLNDVEAVMVFIANAHPVMSRLLKVIKEGKKNFVARTTSLLWFLLSNGGCVAVTAKRLQAIGWVIFGDGAPRSAKVHSPNSCFTIACSHS